MVVTESLQLLKIYDLELVNGAASSATSVPYLRCFDQMTVTVGHFG